MSAGTRLLVCGGRTFGRLPRGLPPEKVEEARRQAQAERAWLVKVLDEEAEQARTEGAPLVALAHGGASGADALAGAWAEARGIPVEVFEADWEADGRAAGPIRNAWMLQDFDPHRAVAFPGGPGTADMVRKAKRAGVRVRALSFRDRLA